MGKIFAILVRSKEIPPTFVYCYLLPPSNTLRKRHVLSYAMNAANRVPLLWSQRKLGPHHEDR